MFAVSNMAVVLLFLDVILSSYLARGFYELFLDRFSFSYYYWLHFCFTLHMCCISIARSLYLKTFSSFFFLVHSSS
jgi:hypothetical protein